MDSHSWMFYISIVVLLLLSAFFSASETALNTLNKIRLGKKAQDGDPKAKAALGLTEHYDKTLTTILVGNNLVNIATSTIATLIFTALLPNYGALVSTIVTTVLVLTFGEILPKSYAKSNADKVALGIAQPLSLIAAILTPFSYLFGKLQHAFHKRTGAEEEKTPSITEEELHYFIESIEDEGILEEQESNLVQSALEFDETAIREIITPRVNIVALDIDSNLRDVIQTLLEANHSRLPLYEGSIDNIVGILFVRDAMRRLVKGEELVLRDVMEEPYFVHKGMKLPALLTVFQSQKVRMAVVLDEYGGTLGIVTLVDLLEELVGDFYDEEETEGLLVLDDGNLEMTGGYDLWDMFEEIGVDEDEVESDASTVNGWALDLLGHIPEVGETFDAHDWRFTVLAIDGHRIERMGAEQLEPPGEEGGEPEKED